MPKKKELKWVVDENDCWICTSHKYNKAKSTDYLHYWDSEQKKYTLLHRYMYEKYYSKIPKGICVRHKCDNSFCINPGHLELGTRADNNRDRVIRGRSACGERHGKAKLTEQQVKEIFLNNDLGACDLGRKYNVPHATIFKIKKRINWRKFTQNLVS